MSSIIGLSGIFFAIHFVLFHPQKGFTGYYDEAGIVLLGIVPPCIMLLSHRLSDFFIGIKILFQSIFNNTGRQQTAVINALTICSAKVRKDGVGALISEKKHITNDLLLDGISLIMNNFSIDEIRHNLQAKINTKQSKMSLASNLFENLSKICPGVGMMGTLMGLIQMMSKLSDPSSIGSGMALALITTLYGLVLGTILYQPFGEKIMIESEKIYDLDLLVLEGVLALKDKKSSAHLKDIMKTYGSEKQSTQPGRKN